MKAEAQDSLWGAPQQDDGIIDLFLCHNGADKEWVRRFGEQVESETDDGNPDGRKLRVWLDEWDIDVGQNVVLKINAGLENARFVAVVLSPEMISAPWPALEWTHLVAGDPSNQVGRLIPIFLRDGTESDGDPVSLPAPFRALNWIDFRDQRQFRKSFLKLVRRLRGMPPERGKKRTPLAMLEKTVSPALIHSSNTAAAPDPVPEAVLGNLLPVLTMPKIIWGATTHAREAKEVFEHVKDTCAFELKEGKLFTFTDLSRTDNCFAPVVQLATARTEQVGNWAQHPDRARWLVGLCNRCLKNMLFTLPVRQDEKGRYYFLPNRDGSTRVWKNKSDPEREVAAKKMSISGESEFWVHQGAWISFKILGDNLFLLFEPTYVFTSDGRTSLGGKKVGSLAIQWTARQRNAAILRSVIFWARTLAHGQAQIAITTGSVPITLSGIPAVARTRCGIEDDHIALGTLITQLDDELGIVAAAVDPQRLEDGENDEE